MPLFLSLSGFLSFGFPVHFINIVIRLGLHSNARIKFKVGDIDTEVNSGIGVRQGNIEGPCLFIFYFQAALETMKEVLEKTFDKEGEFDPTVIDAARQRDPKPIAWVATTPTDAEIKKAITKLGNDKAGKLSKDRCVGLLRKTS